MIDGRPLLILMAAAMAGSLALSPQVALASHNAAVATFHVDVDPVGATAGTTGESYVVETGFSPDTNPDDNGLSAGTVDSCIQIPNVGSSGTNVEINIVGQNMQDVTAYDIRLLVNPNHVSIDQGFVDHTPFGPTGFDPASSIGFINLPWDPLNFARRTDAGNIANSVDNTLGVHFFSDTYSGPRTSFASPDVTHSPSSAEPYTANRGGVPLVKMRLTIKSAANGQVVLLDLTNAITPGNDYISFDPASSAEEIIPVPNSNLIDGAIAVAPATCPAGANPAPSEPTATPSMTSPAPAPTATRTPTTSPPTTATGGADGGSLTKEQLEELTEATIESLIEKASAGQTSVDAVLHTVTADGSTEVLAICADENANPLPNLDITFKIDKQPGSDSSLDGQAEVRKTSDAEGVAEATLNVGNTAGEIVVSATAEECSTQTITVTVEASAGDSVPAGGAAIGDDDGGSGGFPWEIAVFVAVGTVLLATTAGLIWRWRWRRRPL